MNGRKTTVHAEVLEAQAVLRLRMRSAQDERLFISTARLSPYPFVLSSVEA